MQAEQTSFLFGANAPFIEELYARFLDDPSRVEADWRTFFEALAEERGDVLAEVRGASWAPNGARVIDVPDTEMPRAAANRNVNAGKGAAMPLAGRIATRSVRGALLVGLAANAMNQLDTKPGRALKAYAALALPLRAPLGPAVLIAPYDLREMAMLGDAGSNALGAVLGFSSVELLVGRRRWGAIGALSLLTLIGERRSLGALIESTPGLRALDRLGRQA